MSSSKTRRRKPSRTGNPREQRGSRRGEAIAASPELDIKARKLCAQVERALSGAIEEECGDAALRELTVVSVTPEPTMRRLRVWVVGPPEQTAADEGLVLERLEAARGFLRVRVAEAIHRKRTPELAFAFAHDELGEKHGGEPDAE